MIACKPIGLALEHKFGRKSLDDIGRVVDTRVNSNVQWAEWRKADMAKEVSLEFLGRQMELILARIDSIEGKLTLLTAQSVKLIETDLATKRDLAALKRDLAIRIRSVQGKS